MAWRTLWCPQVSLDGGMRSALSKAKDLGERTEERATAAIGVGQTN